MNCFDRKPYHQCKLNVIDVRAAKGQKNPRTSPTASIEEYTSSPQKSLRFDNKMVKQISESRLKMAPGQFGSDSPDAGGGTGTSKMRFWILFLFSFFTMLCGMAVPQFVSMTDLNECFYGVSAEAVNWTSLIVMAVYIPFVFPASWIMGRIGLRATVIMGSVCNSLSAAVQFASTSPGGFAYVMLTSFFASLSNACVMTIPPCLAAVWFPGKEVSRACAVGVFGNLVGVALGFVLSPLLISSDCGNKDLIARGKRDVSIILLSLNLVVLVLVFFTYKEKPKHPPSFAQAEKGDGETSYLRSASTMVRNVNFVLLFLSYGLVVGTYFAIATLLNAIILSYFPGSEVAIGWMGLVIVFAGFLGSIIAAYILDYTRRFKETTVSICVLSLLSYVVFSGVLRVDKLWLQFLTIGVLGFFLTSFLPVGLEYAIEVTYPESEIMSAGLLNSSTMIFGIILTEISSYCLENFGVLYANSAMGVALLLGAIMSCFIKKDYKRSEKNDASKTTAVG